MGSKGKFRVGHGWDGRDYKLWSQIRVLPSYGIVAGKGNRLITLNDVIRLLEYAAEKRFSDAHNKRR